MDVEELPWVESAEVGVEVDSRDDCDDVSPVDSGVGWVGERGGGVEGGFVAEAAPTLHRVPIRPGSWPS